MNACPLTAFYNITTGLLGIGAAILVTLAIWGALFVLAVLIRYIVTGQLRDCAELHLPR